MFTYNIYNHTGRSYNANECYIGLPMNILHAWAEAEIGQSTKTHGTERSDKKVTKQSKVICWKFLLPVEVDNS